VYFGGIDMTNHKLLAALCYFSVFFAPFLLPGVIYFVTDDREVKHHAKRSLVSHLVPVVLLIAGFVIYTFSMFSASSSIEGLLGQTNGFGFWTWTPVLFTLIYGLLFLAIVVWNVFQGVKMIR
jgi:hypothetical protein